MRKTNVETVFWRESAMGSCGSLPGARAFNYYALTAGMSF
jgi:hypothetical protein